MKTITVEIDDTVYELLQVLTRGERPVAHTVKEVVQQLIDHAQQGIYRPGAWERQWLTSVFWDEWVAFLEPGDPYNRDAHHAVISRDEKQISPFQRPVKPSAGGGLDDHNL